MFTTKMDKGVAAVVEFSNQMKESAVAAHQLGNYVKAVEEENHILKQEKQRLSLH